jgi:hypothetical protein
MATLQPPALISTINPAKSVLQPWL